MPAEDLLAEVRRRAAARRRRRHRLVAASAGAAAVAALAIALPLALASGGRPSTVKVVTPPITTVPTTIVPTTIVPTTTVPALKPPFFVLPQVVTPGQQAVPEVVCPTVMGGRRVISSIPTSVVNLDVPGAAQLAVYTDDGGTLQVVAPRDWTCTALDATDGSAQVVVTPPGETPPSSVGAGWHLAPGSTVQAITASETSACAGCTLGQACPLFTAAATGFANQFGRPCPAPRPQSETVTQIGAGVVGFLDPPGTAADGVPSGGAYPANGVMTYQPGNPRGSWTSTCTLPPSLHRLCTSSLNRFLVMYANN